ncbi:MAG TPA: lactate 2-monooxygenase [Longimicrobiaceae bacterium]|nr:lactate 2-monooxygenase [Longimicrobiaceae bacterium]
MSQTALNRQAEIYLAGVRGEAPAVPVSMPALEEAARKAMSREAYAYVTGGAGLESTVAANRAALERWRIVPRMLRDVSQRDTSVELFGRRLPAPLLVAPIGVLELAHAEADLAVARAAAEAGVPMIFSSQASVPMEACAAAMGEGPRWFQLYWSRNDALVESFVGRAEACGCEAIVVTLDTTMLGWRTRDLDLAYLPFLRGKGIAQYVSDPVFQASLAEPATGPTAEQRKVNLAALRVFFGLARSYPGSLRENLRTRRPLLAVQQFIATYSRPSLTWDDLPFLRARTRLPILLKGILHPDDARRTVDAGVDGVIVSNHGGRQVDGAVGAADALPGVVEAAGGSIPVLFDSGVRGGADVFRALALGARAVCVGRPYVYALALAGERGVLALLRNLMADFELTMGLAGCRSVDEITRESLVRAG